MNTLNFSASSKSPFMSLAYVWTGDTYFSKIHPCLMMYDGQIITFVDKDNNTFLRLSSNIISTIKYSNGRLKINTKTNVINNTNKLIILFYEEMSDKAVIPSSYAAIYEQFINTLSLANQELADAIKVELSISKELQNVGYRNPLRLWSTIGAAKKMNVTADTKDTVAQAWSQVLASSMPMQYGITVREMNKRVIAALIAFFILSFLVFIIVMIFLET